MYRFGDATPFPLEENFIDTLLAATDAVAALFRADAAAEVKRQEAEAAGREARAELERLGNIAHAIEQALRPALGPGRALSASEQAALKIAQSAASIIKQQRAAVEKRRDAAQHRLLELEPSDEVVAAVGELLLRHQLPRTSWSIHWVWSCETGASTCTLRSQTAGAELDAEYRAALPPESRWAQAVKVADLEPQLAIELQRETGWLKKHPRMRAESLDRMWITQADLSAQQASFVLRRHARKPSEGYLIVMRADDQTLPTLTRVDAGGAVDGRPLTLGGDAGMALSRLWRHIEQGMSGLRHLRSSLVKASQAGDPIERTSELRRVGEAILDTVAPIIREMRLRSRVPGELILKRDLGDGKREELFVPRREIEERFADLPDSYRRYFEAVGLSSEATLQFVGRAFPLSGPSPSATLPSPAPAAPPPAPPGRKPRATPDVRTTAPAPTGVRGKAGALDKPRAQDKPRAPAPLPSRPDTVRDLPDLPEAVPSAPLKGTRSAPIRHDSESVTTDRSAQVH